MGLIDFVKEAGQQLLEQAGGLRGKEEKTKDQAAAELSKTIHGLGLSVEDLSIQVEGDVATVSGKAQSQPDREKVILAVGNTQGIAKVDDRLTVEQAEPEATYYTVQKGDSLSKIAKAHYGDAMKYPVIFEANRPMLDDPDKIYPGQKLRIPPQ
jgi:nucleoid-associated protein YgaU